MLFPWLLLPQAMLSLATSRLKGDSLPLACPGPMARKCISSHVYPDPRSLFSESHFFCHSTI